MLVFSASVVLLRFFLKLWGKMIGEGGWLVACLLICLDGWTRDYTEKEGGKGEKKKKTRSKRKVSKETRKGGKTSQKKGGKRRENAVEGKEGAKLSHSSLATTIL